MKEKTNMKNIKRIFLWFFWNFLLLEFGIWGIVYKYQWCENVFLFFIWTNVVFAVIAAQPKSKELLRKRGQAVPSWIAIGMDLFMVVLLASVARFISAGAYFMQMLIEQSIYDKPDEVNNEK